MRTHPDAARLLHARGVIAQEAGDLDSARRDFDRALDLDATLVPARASRAALHHELGDYEAALADLDVAVGASPDDPDLLYNRGYVHQSAGRFDAAIRDYDAALTLPGADREELLRQRELCQTQPVSQR